MSRYSAVAAILIAAAIFIFDTLTSLDIAIAVLYVAVVLLSLYFTDRRGIKTTLPLFQRLIREPEILAGNYDIHWLENYLAQNKV